MNLRVRAEVEAEHMSASRHADHSATGPHSALRARRKELRLSQQDLAELAGVSVRFIHDLEAGKPSVQLDRLLAVARTLGLELQWRVRAPEPGTT